MEKTTIKEKYEDIRLPEGYDIINDYQNNVEQAVVDNLFDYFGRVYYKNYDGNPNAKKPRNHYISKYDVKLFDIINKKIIKFLILAIIFTVLAVVGYVIYYFVAGPSFGEIKIKINDLVGTNGWDKLSWEFVFYFTFALICLIALIALIFIGLTIYWSLIKYFENARINSKIDAWNKVFYNFTHHLSKTGLYNSLQAAIPELVFDKHTPIYDRKNYNLHSRIYAYADIPRDARKIDFKNLFSGFYKGCPFNVSYSAWEWFREAKIVDETISDDGHKALVNVRRSLRRFEDKICVLSLDTFAENKLNFVLNNPDGRNLRLQNKIFNNIFTLAVNNPKLAYIVFTPYVQHTLARCKTWSDSSRAIRQVIKEGNKIYVVFDGKADFFLFDRITNPQLNYVFNSRNEYVNVVSGVNQRRVDSLAKKFAVGSLDETASLMVEYILEELDVLFTSLEMATCYPLDQSLIAKEKNKRTLYDVLEEKTNENNNLKFKTINDLEQRISQIEQANVNLSEPWQPRFHGERINLKEDKPFLEPEK